MSSLDTRLRLSASREGVIAVAMPGHLTGGGQVEDRDERQEASSRNNASRTCDSISNPR